jgi:hypothetical protein
LSGKEKMRSTHILGVISAQRKAAEQVIEVLSRFGTR